MGRSNEMEYNNVASSRGANASDVDAPALDINVTTEYVEFTEDRSDVAKLLWIYMAPIIFTVGVLGNVLVLLVMRRRRMSGSTTSVYLRFLAIFDIAVLVVGMIPEWFEAKDILEFKEIHPVTCKLEKFCFYTCSDTAIWILVIFTLDRFHALVFPFSKLDICQPHRAKYNILIVAVAAVIKNVHVFITRGRDVSESIEGNVTEIHSENCGKPQPYADFENYVRPWIAFALVSAVPFCVLLFCNIFIIRVLYSVKKMRNHQAIAASKDKTIVQMSLMCLSASFCFLFCITPSIVLLIGKPYWKPEGEVNYAYDIAKAVSNQLTYINHSANFFLYCLSGKRFRRELVQVLKCVGNERGSPIGSTDSKTYVYRFNTTKSPQRSPLPHSRAASQGNINGLNGSNARYYKVNPGTGKMTPDHSPDAGMPMKPF